MVDSIALGQGATDARTRLYSTVATSSLVLYVVRMLLMSYSYLLTAYTNVASFDIAGFVSCLSVLMMALAILLKPRPLKRWLTLLVAVVMAASMLSANTTMIRAFLNGVLLLAAISDLSLKDALRWYGIVLSAGIVMIILTSLILPEATRGCIPNDRLVYSYGFQHPNLLGAILFSAIGSLVYVYWGRRKLLLLVFLPICLLSAVFSRVGLSSTASVALFAMMAILIVANGVIKKFSMIRLNKWLFAGPLIALAFICLLVMLISTVMFDSDNSLLVAINKVLHGRPRFANAFYLENGGFTLVGRRYIINDSYLTGLSMQQVDSGYCLMLLVYGFATLASAGAMYCVALWKMPRENRTLFLWLSMMVAALYLMVEREPMYGMFFTFLFLSYAFSSGDRYTCSGELESLG